MPRKKAKSSPVSQNQPPELGPLLPEEHEPTLDGRCHNCGQKLEPGEVENCKECAEKPAPKEISEDFDTALFVAPAKITPFAGLDSVAEDYSEKGLDGVVKSDPTQMCPFFPSLCIKAETTQCTKECERNPESYMDPKIKAVFDKEPYSNYCFTCGEFVPSRQHEGALDPPELVYSHVVGTGYHDYRLKLAKWVMSRLGGGI